MKQYSSKISLVKNSRGVWCLDTTMGCESGMRDNEKGCYGDCYAARTAKLYGHDFSTTVLRRFEDKRHEQRILRQIGRIELDFVRIGASGDPSENWEHTVSVLRVIQNCNKEIVVITKHWQPLSDEHLQFFGTLNICVNTSVSALDDGQQLANALFEYHRIKPFCRSVLRIVSCDFNLENETGKSMAKIQDGLFENEGVIDTVFRPTKNNLLVTNGVINVQKGVFSGSKCLMSKRNRKTYTGKCGTCLEMCGVEIKVGGYQRKRPLYKQGKLF